MINTTKNTEVEIRARLNDIAGFKILIEKLGAKLVSTLHVCDVYFCVKTARCVKDVEMDNVGSYSLRLRQSKKDQDKEHFTINTKTIINHGDHNAWEEHEIEINSFQEAAKILNMTEFKPFFKLEKKRIVYKLDTMEICVENIKDFGGAVEIEIMCSANQATEAKQKIKDFLLTCGIDKEKIVPKSITNIIMKERAFNQEIII